MSATNATWTTVYAGGLLTYGGPLHRGPIHATERRCLVLGPVRFEPNMVRVRLENGEVHRAQLDDIELDPA